MFRLIGLSNHCPRFSHSNKGASTMIKKLIALGAVTASAVLSAPQLGRAQEYLSGMKWDEPKVVTPGKTSADPPSDAIILFDGKDLSAWENGDKWIVKDGVATIGK